MKAKGGEGRPQCRGRARWALPHTAPQVAWWVRRPPSETGQLPFGSGGALG